ncbi:MAG: metallophosphoesterase family protein, partial [Nanoarchaeota archaeon]
MRYFVLGDIHANIEGLTACLQDYLAEFNPSLKMREKISLGLKSMGYEPNILPVKKKNKQRELYGEREKIICLGDVVGYGASPNECVELTFALADEIVLGNHDVGLCSDEVLEELGFNLESKEVIKWTRKELHLWNREELERLYQQRRYVTLEGSLVFSHGMPKEAEEFYYCGENHGENKDARWLFNFPEYQDKIVFMGHSHKPFCFRRSPEG